MNNITVDIKFNKDKFYADVEYFIQDDKVLEINKKEDGVWIAINRHGEKCWEEFKVMDYITIV